MKKESIKLLFEAKKEFGKLLRNKNNPFFKSKYADLNALLETVEEPLANHGLMILQPVKDHKVYTLIVEVDTGDTVIESDFELPKIDDPQKIGSAITYYRRYTLQALLGLNADDDDGNKAAGNQTKPKSKNGKTKIENKKELNETQFQKLLMPENYQYIERYLNTYEMPESWRKELNEKAGISKEIKK